MSNLIPLQGFGKGKEMRVDSRVIAQRLELDHQSVMKSIYRFEEKLKRAGDVIYLTEKKTRKKKKRNGEYVDLKSTYSRGKPEKFAALNEPQANFVGMSSRNTDLVADFKMDLSLSYQRYKNAYIRQAAHQGQVAWQQGRSEGKLIRREETDTIKLFVEYATEQGSKNAKMYYANISKMVNKSLFFLEQALPKPNNFRDLLDRFQLANLTAADILVAKTLKEEILKGSKYKDIYIIAKGKIEALADVIGKTQAIGSQDVKHIKGAEK